MFFLCVGSFGNEFGSRMSVSGIVQLKLYDLTEAEDCPFVLWIGSRRLIKRKTFDEYIEKMYSI